MTSSQDADIELTAAEHASVLRSRDLTAVASAENEGMPQQAHRERRQTSGTVPAETTTLERRVLAHERILKTLIAHMSEREPQFLERLKEVFSESVRMSRREHNFTDTDDYADEFVREVLRIKSANLSAVTKAAAWSTRHDREFKPHSERATSEPTSEPLFRIHAHGGIWHVLLNNRFYGDFLREEDALESVRLGMRELTQRSDSSKGSIAVTDIRFRDDIWEVSVSGRFHGRYESEQEALDAAQLALRVDCMDEG